MIRLTIYLTFLVDFGLLFLIRGLKFIYGLTDENNFSAETFEKYKTMLVPTRDRYILGTFVLNFLVIGLLTISRYRQKEKTKLGTIEKLGLFISILTILILSFLKIFVPSGRII